MQTIGLDLANRTTKIVGAGYNDRYINRLQRLYGNEINIGEVSNKRFEYDGVEYILSGKGNTSGGRNSARYSTKDYLIENLVAISQIVTQKDVHLVVGMPSEDYKSEKKQQELLDNLLGHHKIKYNGKTKEFIITKIDILVQPLGTLVDYVFDLACGIVENRHKYRYVVIDIGQGTTDLVATEGLMIEKVVGFNIGCMDILEMYLDLINKKVQDRHNIKFHREDFPNHLTPLVTKYNEEFDFTHELNTAKSAVIDMIKTAINDSGIDLSQYDRILYTGGGAIALKNYLQLESNCAVYPNAQMANAKGFYKYGLIQRG